MTNLKEKIIFWIKSFNFNKEIYERTGIKPSRDWSIIVIIFFILFIFILIFNIYFYIQIQKGKLFLISNTKSLEEAKVNNDLLEKIIKEIDTKENLKKDIYKDIPSDPSI